MPQDWTLEATCSEVRATLDSRISETVSQLEARLSDDLAKGKNRDIDLIMDSLEKASNCRLPNVDFPSTLSNLESLISSSMSTFEDTLRSRFSKYEMAAIDENINLLRKLSQSRCIKQLGFGQEYLQVKSSAFQNLKEHVFSAHFIRSNAELARACFDHVRDLDLTLYNSKISSLISDLDPQVKSWQTQCKDLRGHVESGGARALEALKFEAVVEGVLELEPYQSALQGHHAAGELQMFRNRLRQGINSVLADYASLAQRCINKGDMQTSSALLGFLETARDKLKDHGFTEGENSGASVGLPAMDQIGAIIEAQKSLHGQVVVNWGLIRELNFAVPSPDVDQIISLITKLQKGVGQLEESKEFFEMKISYSNAIDTIVQRATLSTSDIGNYWKGDLTCLHQIILNIRLFTTKATMYSNLTSRLAEAKDALCTTITDRKSVV